MMALQVAVIFILPSYSECFSLIYFLHKGNHLMRIEIDAIFIKIHINTFTDNMQYVACINCICNLKTMFIYDLLP